MALLIEADLSLPTEVYMDREDVLLVKAAGGHVTDGYGVVEMLGPFNTATLQATGEPLEPMGSPNTVLFIAREEGRATVDVVMGDPWAAPQATQLRIIVGP